MKERPILFSAPMVRAILAGQKTQTRRVVKPVGNDGGFVLLDHGKGWWPYRSDDGDSTTHTVKRGGKLYHDETPHASPYGTPGDHLWVREAFGWAQVATISTPIRQKLVYRADFPDEYDMFGIGNWFPSIHLKRIHSRLLLEVTNIRVERLQSISPTDAAAEGIHHDDTIPFNGPWFASPTDSQGCGEPAHAYANLWESINGPGSWDANPWVWVIEFKRA